MIQAIYKNEKQINYCLNGDLNNQVKLRLRRLLLLPQVMQHSMLSFFRLMGHDRSNCHYSMRTTSKELEICCQATQDEYK